MKRNSKKYEAAVQRTLQKRERQRNEEKKRLERKKHRTKQPTPIFENVIKTKVV